MKELYDESVIKVEYIGKTNSLRIILRIIRTAGRKSKY
jgi:hypothetical protein